MLDFVTIGGATRDIFFDYDGLTKKKDKDSLSDCYLMVPYGEKLVAKKTHYAYGGGAVNAAISIARLGGRVASICNVGAEGTGSLVVRKLRDEGVNTQMLVRDPKNHTGLSIFILGRDNEHTGFLERGANNYLKIKKISNLKKARWLYVSSLTGESDKLLPEIFKYAEKKNIRIAFNPGSRQLSSGYQNLSKYLSQTEILLLNLDEAEKLVKSKTGRKPKSKRALFKEIGELGATIAVVTEGANGSHAIFEGNIYSQVAYSEEVVDTTGAGDAFGSTFAFGIARGFDISYALQIAAINSASVVSKMGAQDGLLRYNEIRHSRWL
ncbi:MAG: carbohydrate kinase family protein [Patescibacteria group bacterium]|nr:carbohydrate kinase family protein [Patescibacteria group bacterium]